MPFITKTQSLDRCKARHHRGALVACLGVAAVLSLSTAANAETDTSSFLSLSSVADSELERLRGGFRTARGLEVRFGIKRLTRINGQIHNDRSFKVTGSVYTADESGPSYQHTTYNDAFKGMTSTIPKEVFGQFSLIQNRLNNQLIQSVSIVDIRIANLLTLHSRLSMSRWIAESARDF